MFMVLFATTGIGNGSTFRMIPVIFMTEAQRDAGSGDEARARRSCGATRKVPRCSVSAPPSPPMAPSSFRGGYGTSIALTGSGQRRPVGIHRLLPDLHRDDLVVLLAPQRGSALLSVR
jgi:MFS transporter, NNP family, nitrate/nitrite transporter